MAKRRLGFSTRGRLVLHAFSGKAVHSMIPKISKISGVSRYILREISFFFYFSHIYLLWILRFRSKCYTGNYQKSPSPPTRERVAILQLLHAVAFSGYLTAKNLKGVPEMF